MISADGCWWRRASDRRAILVAVAGAAASARSGRRLAQTAISSLMGRPRRRSRDDQRLDLALGIGALVDGAAAGHPQVAERLDTAVTLFGSAGPIPGQDGLGGLDRVDGVGLALEASSLTVGTVDLDRLNVLLAQKPGQPGPVGTGAFHPDPRQAADGAHPGQQRGVPGLVGRELPGAQHPPHLVDHSGGVGVLVGVDSTSDLNGQRVLGCNGGHRRPVARDWGQGGTHQPSGRTRQRWGLWPGSYKVTPPRPVSAHEHLPARADRSR